MADLCCDPARYDRGECAGPNCEKSEPAPRSCTCHPSEAPVPCQRKYALTDCLISASAAENARLLELNQAQEKTLAVLREALEKIAHSSAASDDHEWWLPVHGCQPYPLKLADGTVSEIGVDDSNSGDVHEHGVEQGVWSMAKIARAALEFRP